MVVVPRSGTQLSTFPLFLNAVHTCTYMYTRNPVPSYWRSSFPVKCTCTKLLVFAIIICVWYVLAVPCTCVCLSISKSVSLRGIQFLRTMFKLNPNAKTFKFNLNAQEFKPPGASFSPVVTAASSTPASPVNSILLWIKALSLCQNVHDCIFPSLCVCHGDFNNNIHTCIYTWAAFNNDIIITRGVREWPGV